ncbi:MAG: hypothetical protein IH875_10980, partial [Candidatus Dadabacteria bacterium]|nr:hypothetical protein [Candidatus Dadabacteria bacterium]
MSRNVILIAIIIVVAAYFYMNSKDKEEQQVIEPETSNQEGSAQREAPSINLESEELIENLVKEGIISK